MRAAWFVLVWGLFFIMAENARAETPSVIINEIHVEGESPVDDFVELYNPTDVPISMAGWKLQKQASTGTISSLRTFPGATIIPARSYFLWAHSAGAFASVADTKTTATLSANNGVRLLTAADVLVDAIAWTTIPAHQSFARRSDTSGWELTTTPTPRSENTFFSDEVITEPDETPETADESTVRINEIFPNPKEKGEGDEYIELFNYGDENVNLAGFLLSDASGAGYIFPSGAALETAGYLILPRSLSKLSLNNSSESLTLSDSAGHVIQNLSYGKTKEAASYGYDGTEFRWSRSLTPGGVNQFESPPRSQKEEIPEEALVDVPAWFAAGLLGQESENGQTLQAAWDFGDGTKSRKPELFHTYKGKGVYQGSLTLDNGLEETVKAFTVAVTTFKAPRVEIIALSPNPAGSDTGNEWLLIKNRGTKKVNLENWSIASGTSKKKLANHPIHESFVIKAGGEKKLTSESAALTLPNKSGYVELRLPNKERVQKVKYADGEEGALYKKVSKKEWAWVEGAEAENEPEETVNEEASVEQVSSEQTSPSPGGHVLGVETRALTLADLSPEDRATLEDELRERLREEITQEILSEQNKQDPTNEPETQGGSDKPDGGWSEFLFESLNEKMNALFRQLSFLGFHRLAFAAF